jgi:hypothetical protein
VPTWNYSKQPQIHQSRSPGFQDKGEIVDPVIDSLSSGDSDLHTSVDCVVQEIDSAIISWPESRNIPLRLLALGALCWTLIFRQAPSPLVPTSDTDAADDAGGVQAGIFYRCHLHSIIL